MITIARKTYPKLTDSTINAIFYHLFSWKDRKSLFTKIRGVPLKKLLNIASKEYPELSPKMDGIKQKQKRYALRALGNLKKSFLIRWLSQYAVYCASFIPSQNRINLLSS